MPSFSVIIPCFNYARTLAAAIRSALEQEGVDVEVVVVDDGSSDDTAVVARHWATRYPDRVRLLEQANAGPGAARNLGARHARGEWLLFLDADDALLAGALSRYLRAARLRPDARIVVAGNRLLRHGAPAGARSARVPRTDPLLNFRAFVRGELCECNGAAAASGGPCPPVPAFGSPAAAGCCGRVPAPPPATRPAAAPRGARR